MTVFYSTVDVPADRRVVLQLPPGLAADRVRVTVTTEEAEPKPPTPAASFPVIAGAKWPDGMPSSRAEMYHDDGR